MTQKRIFLLLFLKRIVCKKKMTATKHKSQTAILLENGYSPKFNTEKKFLFFCSYLLFLLQQLQASSTFQLSIPPSYFQILSTLCTFRNTAFRYRPRSYKAFISSLNDCIFLFTALTAIPSFPLAQNDDVRTVFWSQQTCQKRVQSSPPPSLVLYRWSTYFHSGNPSTLIPTLLIFHMFFQVNWTAL